MTCQEEFAKLLRAYEELRAAVLHAIKVDIVAVWRWLRNLRT